MSHPAELAALLAVGALVYAAGAAACHALLALLRWLERGVEKDIARMRETRAHDGPPLVSGMPDGPCIGCGSRTTRLTRLVADGTLIAEVYQCGTCGGL